MRLILHVVVCAAVLAIGVVGGLDQHMRTAPRTTAEASPSEADAVAVLAPALLALPKPGLAIVEAPTTNSVVPALPDAQMATRTYVVEEGDSVRTIATRFSVTNETIIWENDLSDPDLLRVGQELKILPFSGLIHEVRPGDSVASVANAYDALIRDVVGVNHLSEPYIIVVGQKLAVPGGYRPLPQKVVVNPTVKTDIVQAPHTSDDQVAATVRMPRARQLPRLGSTPQEQFIGSIAEAAVESADRTGVPASVTIAQAILESYWGSSRLAREASNYFGIKAQTRGGSAGSIWFNVWEVIGGRNVVQSQAFRAYTSGADSFVDHGRFFTENRRYAAAMATKNDPRQFAREVNRAGYATDPGYASKLIGLMDRYDLYRYDEV